MSIIPETFRPVRWTFDTGSFYDGWTDGSTWNGWLNVWVTPETHAALCVENLGGDADTDAEFRAMAPDPATGLIRYGGGFTAREAEPGEEEEAA